MIPKLSLREFMTLPSWEQETIAELQQTEEGVLAIAPNEPSHISALTPVRNTSLTTQFQKTQDFSYFYRQAASGRKDYMLRAYYDETFSDEEIAVLTKGFSSMLAVISKSADPDSEWQRRVFELHKGTYDYPPPDGSYPDWGGLWIAGSPDQANYLFLSYLWNYHDENHPQHRLPRFRPVFVHRYETDPDKEWAYANVGTFFDTFVFTMKVNATAIAKSDSASSWASVLFHEMLHNFGWDHSADGCQPADGSSAMMCQMDAIVQDLSA